MLPNVVAARPSVRVIGTTGSIGSERITQRQRVIESVQGTQSSSQSSATTGPLKDREYRQAISRRLWGALLTGTGLMVAVVATPESITVFNCPGDLVACPGGGSRPVQLLGLGAAATGVYFWLTGQARMKQIERERAAAARSTALLFGVGRNSKVAEIVFSW
jgi:hypothetical protein